MHASDVRNARVRIRTACEQASSEWVPSNAIADALLLEYIDYVARMTAEQNVLQHLERLVSALKSPRKSDTLQ